MSVCCSVALQMPIVSQLYLVEQARYGLHNLQCLFAILDLQLKIPEFGRGRCVGGVEHVRRLWRCSINPQILESKFSKRILDIGVGPEIEFPRICCLLSS